MSARSAFKLSRALVLLPLSALAALGCASIIGLDEYTVAGNAGDAGDAGSSGHSGTGASAGHAGTATSGGNAGKGGSTAQAGEPGAAGTAAAGESGAAGGNSVPAIVGCDGTTTFEPNEDIVRSCLLRAGCRPSFKDPVRNVSTCVTYDTQAALPGESCNLKAKTCTDYEDCEHIGIAHDDLCGGSQKTRCEDNLAVNCGNYETDQFFDCSALGGTCATYTYGASNTVYSDCLLDISPESCSGFSDDTQFYCHTAAGQDDLRYYCWEDQAYGASCSSLASCLDDTTPGSAGCYFSLPKCSGGDTSTCKNGVANVCSGGDLFKYDCGAVGLTCGITLGSEYCLAPGCKAADIDNNCTESCSDDGSELTFCYGGAPYTVKCTDYGFTQCLSDVDSDGKAFAACRF